MDLEDVPPGSPRDDLTPGHLVHQGRDVAAAVDFDPQVVIFEHSPGKARALPARGATAAAAKAGMPPWAWGAALNITGTSPVPAKADVALLDDALEARRARRRTRRWPHH